MTSKQRSLKLGALRRSEWNDAAKNLGRRIGAETVSVRAITAAIASATWQRLYYRDQPELMPELDPGVDEVLDALRLMPAVRYAVDVDERDLIRAARHFGVTWEAIGVALGAAESGARQTARGKYKRLGGDVNAAVPGDAAEQAPALVDAGEPVPAAPADDWPLPGEGGTRVPESTFVEPVLITFDEGPEQ